MTGSGITSPHVTNCAESDWLLRQRAQTHVGDGLMLDDGIYIVHFETPAGQGDGVVVVTGDKIRGGDAAFVYFGSLEPTNNGFSIQIETKRHSQARASVFNMDSVHINLIGKSDGLNAVCTGTAVEVPGLIFKAVLKFIHE